MRLDLNADVGESFGPYSMGRDADLMPHITSANVACGFHAGDPGVMRLTVALARKHGVAVGAHPGFPDLQGFGRREVQMSPREVYDLVIYQVGALAAVAATQGMRLQHVKPHGALYNMAARDSLLADAIAGAVAAVGQSLILVGLAGSELLAAASRAGIPSASEVFADRAYRADGTLVPRSQPGSVIDEPDAVVARTVGIARDRVVKATDGTQLKLEADTICVHGDTAGAADLAARIRLALMEAGVSVQRMGEG
jgi:UPF0271 protein